MKLPFIHGRNMTQFEEIGCLMKEKEYYGNKISDCFGADFNNCGLEKIKNNFFHKLHTKTGKITCESSKEVMRAGSPHLFSPPVFFREEKHWQGSSCQYMTIYWEKICEVWIRQIMSGMETCWWPPMNNPAKNELVVSITAP